MILGVPGLGMHKANDMNSAKILLVEDEFIIAEMGKENLEAAGYGECRHAGTVADALKALEEGSWRGALLDIRLNGELVFPVAEELQARGVPFAFCSGSSESKSVPEKFAGTPTLLKPWSTHEFDRVVKRVLGAA